MAAKKPAARKTTARKRTPAKRTAAQASRKQVARRPSRGGSRAQRFAAWLARRIAKHAANHRHHVRARKDAAILRATHAGCRTCHGTGTLYTKDKHGKLSGSKPCPAKPTVDKVSKAKVHAQARWGVDKHSGLIGWKCPCGAKEKPKYHDAKTVTAAIRTHERRKHGGRQIGASWYAQLPENAKPTTTTTQQKEAPPVSKKNPASGMTDKQWEKQNKVISQAEAARKNLCWQCGGKCALYSAFGDDHTTTVCGECKGTGKAAAAAGSSR